MGDAYGDYDPYRDIERAWCVDRSSSFLVVIDPSFRGVCGIGCSTRVKGGFVYNVPKKADGICYLFQTYDCK